MERFMFRQEPANREPIESPIKSIVFDREKGEYNLLDEKQTNSVIASLSGKLDKSSKLQANSPFPVNLDLDTLNGNTQEIVMNGNTPENILSAPLSVYLEIASRCNLHCRDCYQGERKANNPLSSTEIINFLDRFRDIGGMIVRFTGKEPSTHLKLKDFIQYGRIVGLKMSLNSNGMMSQQYIEGLINAGIQEVVISLDGGQKYNDSIRGVGTFNKAVNTITTLINKGVDTRINMTLSRKNIDQLEYILRLANKMHTYVSVIPMRNLGNASENLNADLLTPAEMMGVSRRFNELQTEMEPESKSFIYFNIFSKQPRYYHPFFQMEPCVARKNIFMDCEGNIYPCDHLAGLGRKFCGGNIREMDLLEIWRDGKGLNRYRNIKKDEKCHSCHEFGVRCDGGCASEALVACNGNTDKIHDRLCFIDQITNQVL